MNIAFLSLNAYNSSMDRDIYLQLLDWKASPRRKPLILNGARQVGKTYALTTFAKAHYENYVYLNFEKDQQVGQYFQDSIDPIQLIKLLAIHSNTRIEPNKTLLIFDEVQENPRALNSLKYFCEEAPEYHVATAGSLLGVKLAKDHGFPVGKVNFLHMYPLSFYEFLSAINQLQLREYLENYTGFEPLPEPLHKQALDFLRYYFYVGGMPEAVTTYIQTDDLQEVRSIQVDILDAYERDFSKHAPADQVMKISTVWTQIHRQLAKENKKFIFSAIKQSARGRDYEEAIQWLMNAGLIYKCYHLSTAKLPLSAYSDFNTFKLYALDVGLLGALSNLAAKTVITQNELFVEFKGALTENYVAQTLKMTPRAELYYWTSAGIAELDFIIEQEGQIFPLEVKSGASTKNKSLIEFGKKHIETTLFRTSTLNLGVNRNVYNYPLYLLENFPPIISSQKDIA